MNVSRPRIWVDTDIALGASSGDVDDGFALAALAAAHRQGTVELVGVSTVFGNATAAISEACALDLLSRAGADVPVVRGAERAGDSTPAAERIVEAGKNNIEIVALGPLSNVAGACRQDAGLAGRTTLRAVGGNLSSRGFLPPLWPFEFNFARDRKSARFALSLPWRGLTVFPLDVVRRLTVAHRARADFRSRPISGRAHPPLAAARPLALLRQALSALGSSRRPGRRAPSRFRNRSASTGARRALAPRATAASVLSCSLRSDRRLGKIPGARRKCRGTAS